MSKKTLILIALLLSVGTLGFWIWTSQLPKPNQVNDSQPRAIADDSDDTTLPEETSVERPRRSATSAIEQAVRENADELRELLIAEGMNPADVDQYIYASRWYEETHLAGRKYGLLAQEYAEKSDSELEQLSSSGDWLAKREKANRARDGGDLEEASDTLLSAAEHGDPEAPFLIGLLYDPRNQGIWIEGADYGAFQPSALDAMAWYQVAVMRGSSQVSPWLSKLSAQVDPAVVQLTLNMAYMYYGQIQDSYRRRTGEFFTTTIEPARYLGLDRLQYPLDLCDPRILDWGVELDASCFDN